MFGVAATAVASPLPPLFPAAVRAASTQLARHPSHPTTPRQPSSLQLVRQLARHPSHPTSPRQPSSLHQTLVYYALRQQDSVSPSRVGCQDGVVRMQTFAWDWHRGVNHSELMGRRESWVEAGTPNDGTRQGEKWEPKVFSKDRRPGEQGGGANWASFSGMWWVMVLTTWVGGVAESAAGLAAQATPVERRKKSCYCSSRSFFGQKVCALRTFSSTHLTGQYS